MISGFKFFRTYFPIKLHFTEEAYDAIKYCGKVPNIQSMYENKKDKSIFEQWGRRVKNSDEAGELCLSNQLSNVPDWIYESNQNAISIYTKWKAEHEALTYSISRDLSKLKSIIIEKKVGYNDLIQKTPKGNRPPLLQLYLSDGVLPDTVIVLDRIGNPFINEWMNIYKPDPLLNKKIFDLNKYKPFSRTNTEKIEKLVGEFSTHCKEQQIVSN